MTERRRGQRRAEGRLGRERRCFLHTVTITKRDLVFVRTCPCERCREHGICECMECSGILQRSAVEVLWPARFHFRGAFEEFLESRDPVKTFAASDPCPLCARWRTRFMEAVSAAGRKDRDRRLG